MRASQKFRDEHPGQKLVGRVEIDNIKIGDYTYIEGVVEKIRETKLYRFITFYDGVQEKRTEKKFAKGQTICAV